MNIMTIEKLQSIFTKKGYKWDSNLNIISVRNKAVGDTITNKFDDTMYVAYKEQGNWKLKSYAITTDPGKYYLKEKLLNVNGCAILAEGQYPVYQIGYHQGKYPALVQRGPVKVYRDKDKDDEYDFVNITTDPNSGINIHKAGADSLEVNNWSAGCTVFKREKDFNEFMTICNSFKAILGNKFTYTLINSNDLI